MKVLGFVTLQRGPGGLLEHLRGTTISCKWPGTAEQWLAKLVEHGTFTRWERMQPEANEPPQLIPDAEPQAHYRGARVFRVFSSTRENPIGAEPDGAQLMAVWEGRL